MAIGKIKASRVNRVDAETYVGEDGILFYNYANGVIRLSDGVTPGGVPVPYTIASNTVIGGIKAGPGIVISTDGELFIDTANLALSFGDFTANNNVLSIVNSNEDMILSTSGSAEIQLIGNVGFYKPNGIPPNVSNRYFSASDDGQIKIIVETTDTGGAVEIIGSDSNQSISPAVSGVMLHVTGQNNDSSSIYLDGIANTAAFVGRRFNGNAITPTQVQTGQVITRVISQGYATGGFTDRGTGAINFVALENYTTTAQGMQMQFQTAPIGSNLRATVATIDSANGVVATKFTTTGNVSAGNILVTGNTNTTGFMTGKYIRTVRNAGTIAAGGTLTVDFSADAIVYCTWGDGMTVAYSNFIPGRVVKVMCTKTAGTGTDSLSLGAISANQTSSGTTSVTAAADTTTFIELTSTTSSITGLFAKL